MHWPQTKFLAVTLTYTCLSGGSGSVGYSRLL